MKNKSLMGVQPPSVCPNLFKMGTYRKDSGVVYFYQNVTLGTDLTLSRSKIRNALSIEKPIRETSLFSFILHVAVGGFPTHHLRENPANIVFEGPDGRK